ncbi:MAG: hypothetical protein B7Y12_15520 [Rhizobiales bacterium 24-66-13]|uniref:hypothetical protein n=1 Tax=Roseixanthobacter finlandensis TaxID=3119922 RepID=UPI000BD9DE42|nr:MAG: hypothetical protein B7Z15_23285 [Rhizobiales bacterium 32-66-8]OYY59569.1 MAG: hypothetical protein B7Y61_23825 [Rhizobiales bacterium 35-66-30]OYZ72526.1 MAG: hypothetical protein B7Y12_15520 [Rhizobiales bacterium 24-66-13]OZA93574.1 MAG: hypothetical protein B7X67_27745 [Rhizobiales bacterium 39-66-18]
MPRTNTAAVRHRQADPEIEPEPFSPKRHPRAGLKAVDAPKQNLAIEEIAAFAHLRPCDHVVVLGKESLDLALRLWRSGFTNVGCAPRNLDKVAHGGADALIIDHLASGEDFAAAIARNRSFVRRGGWMLVHVARAAGRGALPALRGLLATAGFSAGPGIVDSAGVWIAARREDEAPQLAS